MNEAARPFLIYQPKRSVVAAITDIKLLRTSAKVCCVPIILLLVIAALGPEKWAPRTQLGWQFDHFIGYFGITLYFCFGWPRPFLVGGVFAAVAALLEGLQALTPDRSAYLPAIFYGAGGALTAALVAELFIRVWRFASEGAATTRTGFVSQAAVQPKRVTVILGKNSAQAGRFSTAGRSAGPLS